MTGLRRFFQLPWEHARAAWGTFLTGLFSVVPLLALPLIDSLRHAVVAPNGDVSTEQSKLTFWDTISAGQLFMYTFALFGTLFWLILREYRNNKGVPFKSAFMTIVVLICGYCMIVYTVSPDLKYKLPNWAIYSSILCFAVMTILNYILTVYPELPAQSLQSNLAHEASQMADELDKAEE